MQPGILSGRSRKGKGCARVRDCGEFLVCGRCWLEDRRRPLYFLGNYLVLVNQA